MSDLQNIHLTLPHYPMLLAFDSGIFTLRFSSYSYGKLREKDEQTYLIDRTSYLFHAKNRKKDPSIYHLDSSSYQKDRLSHLRDGLMILLDRLSSPNHSLRTFTSFGK